MLFVKAAPILLLAGSALAAPAPGRDVVVTKQDVTVVTKVVHVAAGSEPTGGAGGFGGGRPGGPPAGMSFPSGAPSSQAGGRGGRPQATPTTVPDTTGAGSDDDDAAPTPTPAGGRGGKPAASSPAGGNFGGQPAASSQGGRGGKPAATSAASGAAPTGSTGGASGGGNAEIDQINKYRAQMVGVKLNPLTLDSKLQSNINKCIQDGNGQMVHELLPGSGGQVLAGGDCGNFVDALVHGWICEIPSLLPSGSCSGSIYKSDGQTGHAKILSDPKYTKAACACQKGIWGCDFA